MSAEPSSPDPAFQTVSDQIRRHARERPAQPALIDGETRLDYAGLDALVDRIAATLQRQGLRPRDVVAICGHGSLHYAAVFLGALRAGAAVAPLAPSVTPQSFASMLGDAQAGWLFADSAALDALAGTSFAGRGVSFDGIAPGIPFTDWLAPANVRPEPVDVQP
ncbi:MAG: AMP-binding protein, partial [Burkholderiaceae bacterium]